MIKQSYFFNSVINNDIENFKILSNNNDITFPDLNWALQYATEKGHLEIFKLLLNDNRIKTRDIYDNFIIQHAALNGQLDIMKLLLNDLRVNPANRINSTIEHAFNNKFNLIVNLLWKDKRVKDTLEKDNLRIYNSLIVKDIKNKVSKF
jgi:ankyrin repeat protein